MLSTIGDLLMFAEVAKAGSLTEASEQLGIPKATVSRRLSQLEEKINVRLLNRTTRKVALTQEGEVILEHCQHLWDDAESALSAAKQMASKIEGILRVTMPSGFGALILSDLLGSFVKKYPQVVLDIDESGEFRDLIRDKIDVAFRVGTLEDSALIVRALPVFAAGFYGSPSLAKQTSKIKLVGDLRKFNFVRVGGNLQAQTISLQSAGERITLTLAPAVCVTTTTTQIALAVKDAGFIFALHQACRPFVERHELVRLFPEWEGVFPRMRVVTPYRTLLPRKTELFIQHILKGLNARA